jgi:hypothetical protein
VEEREGKMLLTALFGHLGILALDGDDMRTGRTKFCAEKPESCCISQTAFCPRHISVDLLLDSVSVGQINTARGNNLTCDARALESLMVDWVILPCD